MKRKLIALFVLLILIGTLAYTGYNRWFEKNHVQIEGIMLPCETSELVIQGNTLPSRDDLLRLYQLETLDVRNIPITTKQYDQLCADFPNTHILWLVPFQGVRYAPDVTELTVTSLSEQDLDSIRYFPNLQTIDANDMQDYPMILTLKDQNPRLEVAYFIHLGGAKYDPETTQLVLENADGHELAEVLPYLPLLEQVEFTGITPDNELIYEMMCQYPHIRFHWTLSLFGIETPNTATTLILSGIPMTAAELETYIRYFPDLERVEVCDCGIPSDDMDPLTKRYPDIRFVWTIKIGNGTLRTDVTAFIPYKMGYHLYRPLYDEDCTELKYCIDMVCLDMGHMKITDISFLESMPHMKYLIVADIPCSDFSAIATLKELIYLEIFVTSFTDHEILLGLANLQDLNIGTTPANDITALKQMTWLKRLWLPGTKINYLQVAELKEALPNTRIVAYADHSTDKGWRQHQNYRDMRDLLGMFYME